MRRHGTQPLKSLLAAYAISVLLPSAALAGEAPMLAEQVAAGKLPPLEQRLPEQPLVVKPVDRVRDHGGHWRSAMVGGSDDGWVLGTVSYENLMRGWRDWRRSFPTSRNRWKSVPTPRNSPSS